jgi:hypothetical protein
MRAALVSAVLITVILVYSAHGAPGKITALEDVPAVVSNAAKRNAPEVKWLSAFTFVEDGKTWYRLVGKDPENHNFQYNARSDGTLLNMRTQIQLGEVPEVVRQALKEKEPDFKADMIQAAGLKYGSITYYRFVGERPGGKKAAIIISKDGKKVLEEGKGALDLKKPKKKKETP